MADVAHVSLVLVRPCYLIVMSGVQVSISATLDPTVPYDLLLVPVKNQVAELLPTLQASSAKTIMFSL